MRQRVGAILAVLSPIFHDGGTVTLVRWLPGVAVAQASGWVGQECGSELTPSPLNAKA